MWRESITRTDPTRRSGSTSIPSSSASSRRTAWRGVSPGSTCPPGKHHAPPLGTFGARRIMSSSSPRDRMPMTPRRTVQRTCGPGISGGVVTGRQRSCRPQKNKAATPILSGSPPVVVQLFSATRPLTDKSKSPSKHSRCCRCPGRDRPDTEADRRQAAGRRESVRSATGSTRSS